MGEINEDWDNGEKIGSPRRLEATFHAFMDMLKCCDMNKFSSSGNKFTYCGRRHKKWICSRFDGCFGNSAWFSLFPESHQWFFERLGSNHRPVLMRTQKLQEVFRVQFRYDKRWEKDPNISSLIKQAWR